MLRISCGDTAVNSEQFQQFFATTFRQEIAWDAAVSQVLVVLPAGSTPMLWSAPSLMVQDELGNISTVEGALTLVQMMMAATLYPQRWFLL